MAPTAKGVKKKATVSAPASPGPSSSSGKRKIDHPSPASQSSKQSKTLVQPSDSSAVSTPPLPQDFTGFATTAAPSTGNLDVSMTEGSPTDDPDLQASAPLPITTGSQIITTSTVSAKLKFITPASVPSHVRQLTLTSSDPQYSLTKLNPIVLAKGIDTLCGDTGTITKLEYLNSGSILVTTSSAAQLRTLLKAQVFPAASGSQIPIISSVSYSHQFTYGKVFAPAFKHMALNELLELLTDQNVVAVRKLFMDPAKASVPLFVLTFLGGRPENLLLGYTSYVIDKYIPNPMRCGNCCRWGHQSSKCRSSTVCGKCSEKGHKHTDCSSSVLKCVNCTGPHAVTSTTCSSYLQEVHACTLQAEHGLSFAEARMRARAASAVSTSSSSVPTSQPSRNFSLQATSSSFPSLPQPASSPQPCVSSQLPTVSSLQSPHTYSAVAAPAFDTDPFFSQVSSIIPLSQPPPLVDPLAISDSYDQYGDLPYLTQPSPPRARVQDSPPLSTPRLPSPSPPFCASSFVSLLSTLLPPLVRIVLSSTLTDKIQALVEIGQLLKADSQMSAILSSMGHTPPPTSLQ